MAVHPMCVCYACMKLELFRYTEIHLHGADGGSAGYIPMELLHTPSCSLHPLLFLPHSFRHELKQQRNAWWGKNNPPKLRFRKANTAPVPLLPGRAAAIWVNTAGLPRVLVLAALTSGLPGL